MAVVSRASDLVAKTIARLKLNECPVEYRPGQMAKIDSLGEGLRPVCLKAAGAGLEILAAPLRVGRVAAGQLRSEIGQIRLAIAAANHFDVKCDVACGPVVQGAQQATAQLLARGAAQPVLPPDFTE